MKMYDKFWAAVEMLGMRQFGANHCIIHMHPLDIQLLVRQMERMHSIKRAPGQSVSQFLSTPVRSFKHAKRGQIHFSYADDESGDIFYLHQLCELERI